MDIRLLSLVGALLVGVLALWRIDAADGGRALAEQSAAAATESRDAYRSRALEQAGVIADQREQMARMTDADKAFRVLAQTITRDGAATRQTLQELKENDQAVAEYLRGAVPAVYGVQFERPATTDPLAYKSGAAVPAGGVPAASAPGNPGQ